jgi:hypothetical protein
MSGASHRLTHLEFDSRKSQQWNFGIRLARGVLSWFRFSALSAEGSYIDRGKRADTNCRTSNEAFPDAGVTVEGVLLFFYLQVYVKGHDGNDGNENADRLANLGARKASESS